jgi:hypothetical protein
MDWLILIDHIAEPGEKKVSGYGKRKSGEQDLLVAMPYEFQLLDGDDILYYSGICGDVENADELSAFEPLDWAMDFAGCTTFKYRKRGAQEWIEL